jgi:hypothetical protein
VGAGIFFGVEASLSPCKVRTCFVFIGEIQIISSWRERQAWRFRQAICHIPTNHEVIHFSKHNTFQKSDGRDDLITWELRYAMYRITGFGLELMYSFTTSNQHW